MDFEERQSARYNEAEAIGDNGLFWLKKGEAFWANSKKTEKDAMQVLKFFDKAIQVEPLNFLAWANKGLILKNLLRVEDALACYERALGINPEYVNAWYNLGVLLGSIGRYKEAKKCFDTALELKPDYELVKRDLKLLLQFMKKKQKRKMARRKN